MGNIAVRIKIQLAVFALLLLLLLPGAADVAMPAVPVAALQTALDRQGFAPGLIDGVMGAKTRAAWSDFCLAHKITDLAAAVTILQLATIPAFTNHIVSQGDLERLGQAPADWQAAAMVEVMAFTSAQELFSEKFHVSEKYLQRLNPHITSWQPAELLGKTLQVPNIQSLATNVVAARVEVDCRQFRLRVYDAADCLLASFPCSIPMAGRALPLGDLKVVVFAPNPNYTFDPRNYPESARAQEIGRKLIIPPGPNNPVGEYWIGLNRPGVGIHGTPHPRTIGSRESHGCFRLANWDVHRLAGMLSAGLTVTILGDAE